MWFMILGNIQIAETFLFKVELLSLHISLRCYGIYWNVKIIHPRFAILKDFFSTSE